MVLKKVLQSRVSQQGVVEGNEQEDQESISWRGKKAEELITPKELNHHDHHQIFSEQAQNKFKVAGPQE